MANTSSLWVVKPHVVSSCLEQLRQLRVHETFTAYLCIRRTAFAEQKAEDLQVDFKEFYSTFLKVPGAPEGRPYIKVFISDTPSPDNLWLNANLAGSFAPSSIRPTSPLGKVVKAWSNERRRAFYSLPDNHLNAVRTEMLGGKKVPIVPLSVFFYRDFALEIDTPHIDGYISVFREEFGFRAAVKQEQVEYNQIFSESIPLDANDWFEPWLPETTLEAR